MFNFRRRKSFPTLNMDDLRPLMLDHAEGEPDQYVVECAPENLPTSESESELRSERQERKAFRNILILGLSFMLLFTSFNTNGIMTVSTIAIKEMNVSIHYLCLLIMPGLLLHHLRSLL